MIKSVPLELTKCGYGMIKNEYEYGFAAPRRSGNGRALKRCGRDRTLRRCDRDRVLRRCGHDRDRDRGHDRDRRRVNRCECDRVQNQQEYDRELNEQEYDHGSSAHDFLESNEYGTSLKTGYFPKLFPFKS
jgi:hypothetical protein